MKCQILFSRKSIKLFQLSSAKFINCANALFGSRNFLTVVAMQLDQGRNMASAIAEFVKGDTFEVTNIKHIYSRLPLSRIPRDSLKHFEISVLRHIRVERVRKTIN